MGEAVKKCESCGCVFSIKNSYYAQKYCSTKCFHMSRRGFLTSDETKEKLRLSNLRRECRKCIRCGSSFSCVHSNPKKYCSHACFMRHRTEKKTRMIVCEMCGKKFRKAASFGNVKYCSKTCYGKANRGKLVSQKTRKRMRAAKLKDREVRRCEWCEAKFECIITSKRRFCSRLCGIRHNEAHGLIHRFAKGKDHPNWRDGTGRSPYPVEWRHIRAKVRERDGYLCQMCLKEQTAAMNTFHVHHIDGNRDNCDLSNLITLCPQCHLGKVHKGD